MTNPSRVGLFLEGDHVFLLDDVITTAASKHDAINRPQMDGYPNEAITVVVAFDRQQGGMDQLRRDNRHCSAIFQILEVASLLHEHGHITQTQHDAVQTFIAENQHHR